MGTEVRVRVAAEWLSPRWESNPEPVAVVTGLSRIVRRCDPVATLDLCLRLTLTIPRSSDRNSLDRSDFNKAHVTKCVNLDFAVIRRTELVTELGNERKEEPVIWLEFVRQSDRRRTLT